MEIIKDQSYGVVPVFKTRDGDWQVLLVQQISYRGANDRFWTFPKGHSEKNETPLQTAKRELEEETNIQHVQVIEAAAFPITYSFKHEGKQIEKTVIYYLGVCNDTAVTINLPEEIAAVAWYQFALAHEKLTHKNAQKVLLQAKQYIENHL